ncbi:hypothetical protein [Stakelama tenebrarum]|uniref:Uncharacterized protein n=1 Tax=Stakelama tenebrarum TaxID=2711215 RepID=A0A6G6Y2I8_9SPHN|nr:hypothetical protein [Sphingosinithalassobacter tenebrarum]QIG79142.1 hypothetical protein G5C33_04625 [Sphingosinithalassobacter tenebrarum]
MQGLPFQTITEFVALGLTLIAGMFFGLAVAPGGRKWKERYQELDVENAAYRHHAETDLREANQRVQQLEAENARLQKASDTKPAASDPAPVTKDEESSGSGWRGWFGWGRDNLSRISGIDEAREKRLNELGIKTYREIEKMTAEDEAALEQRLDLESGTIGNQEWREQAALLRTGHEQEHGSRFTEKETA